MTISQEEFQRLMNAFLTKKPIARLLNGLREGDLIFKKGKTRTTRWFPSNGGS
jgi:hypothetical protein